VPGNCNRLDFLRNPTRDGCSNPHGYFSDQSRVRILRRAQYKVISGLVDQIDQAGVTMGDVDNKVNDVPQHLVQVKAGADELADLMQDSQFLPCQIQSFLNTFD